MAVGRDHAVGCRANAHGSGVRAKELIAANSSRVAKDGHTVMNGIFFVYWIVTETEDSIGVKIMR